MPKVQLAGAGETGGNRRRRGRRIATSLSEINVIPLVDVMLVLLIIFMVTAPMMQTGLEVNLPEARRADQLSSERLFVTVPANFRSEHIVQLGDDQIRLELLPERIRREMENRLDRSVFLRGDSGITYQELMTVMDKLKEGGVEEVGLVTNFPLDGRAS